MAPIKKTKKSLKSSILLSEKDRPDVKDILIQEIKTATEALIVSGYLNGTVARAIIKNAPPKCKVTIVTSDVYENNLTDLLELVESKRVKVFIPVPNGSRQIMHIKAFCFRKGESWKNYAGSMNLTDGGLRGNIELLVKQSGAELPGVLSSLTAPANLIDLETIRDLAQSNNFINNLWQVTLSTKLGKTFTRSLSPREFGIDLTLLPKGILSETRTEGSLINKIRSSSSFTLPPQAEYMKLVNALNALKIYIDKHYLCGIGTFGKITTTDIINPPQHHSDKQLVSLKWGLANAAKACAEVMRGESIKAFNARLIDAVGRRLDELKKKTKGLKVVYKKESDIVKAIKDDIENRHLKEEALKLLDKLGQGAAELNPLEMVFQFKKFNLDQYMGEPQTVYSVLLYEIARTILRAGFREQRYQEFSDPVRSIIKMARDESVRPKELIKWEKFFVQSISDFIQDIEIGELGWDKRLDFELWRRFKSVLQILLTV